jgi:hypothetical protein
MIQINYHQGYVAEISNIMDYDLQTLIGKVSAMHTSLSYDVMEEETAGITFFEMTTNGKMNVLTNLVRQEFIGVPVRRDSMLWVHIVPIENAYMAKFLTRTSVATIDPEDFMNVKINRPIPSRWRRMLKIVLLPITLVVKLILKILH